MPQGIEARIVPLEKSRRTLRAVPTFVANERFVPNRSSEVPIEMVTPNFWMHYALVKEMEIDMADIVERRLDAPLSLSGVVREFDASGDAAVRRVRIALAHVYEFLKTVRKDPRRRYLFCAADYVGQLAGVTSCWRSSGWLVGAVPGWHPDTFLPGTILVTP